MDRTGLFGLFNCDGAPPDRAAAQLLGLPAAALGADHGAAVCDLADPGAAQALEAGGTLTLFLGRLDARDDLARALGLASDTSDVALAAAAFDLYGAETRIRLHGEWTLARWNGARLTLVSSLCQRDPLFYAVRGTRIAIGADLRQLSRIAWVGDAFDPAGLLMALGRASLRAPGDGRTPVIGISALTPGGCVTIDHSGVHAAPPATLPPGGDWRGDLDAAMAEAEALLLRIVRQRMVGGSYACMLSGGLDSSLVAWAAAQALGPGEALQFLTSAAATGTRQIDELAEAAIVAAHLGAPHRPVRAAAAPGPYHPDATLFRDANGPSLDVRHYLYHRFAQETRAAGASLLFDGQFGELTLTNSLPLHAPASPIGVLRDALRARWKPARMPDAADAFHVDLAPHWLAAPPGPLADALRVRATPPRLPSKDETWGVRPGFAKAARAPASLDLGRVRVAMPFRDPRLIALFAGFPAAMLYPKTGARTPGRHLLTGKLPDAIRLRGKGPGFAPDYAARLQSDAEDARAQIALYRRAGADEWIDLDALDRGLARAARGATAHHGEAVRVQLTALAGAFIAWWRDLS